VPRACCGSKMSRLGKFWSLTRREKKCVCEASILLLLSNAVIKLIAFKHIDRLLRFLRSRWSGRIKGDTDREQEIRLVRCSISRAANVLPWKSLCLSRSFVEFAMLNRRGIPAIIFAGARFSSHSSLEAHAWVETDLSGSDMSSLNSDFTTVMRIGTGAANRRF
jgi:Transglutaminase-like superfamily